MLIKVTQISTETYIIEFNTNINVTNQGVEKRKIYFFKLYISKWIPYGLKDTSKMY